MNVVPVLDLLNGTIVRGVAGRRSEYRPLTSDLVGSSEPLEVARALRTRFGFRRLYVADLDAITNQHPNWAIYSELIGDGFELLVDAGIESKESANTLSSTGVEVIVGLESCTGPRGLCDIVAGSASPPIFSLDLIGGRPMVSTASCGWDDDPRGIVGQAVVSGVQRIIVLDLLDVGTSSGGRTGDLCKWIQHQFSGVEVTCGGGVRGPEDLVRLRDLGVANVLVASALHDGRLTPESVARASWSGQSQGSSW